MRKVSIVVAIAACAASSMALAQQREQVAETAAPAVHSADAGESVNRGKSGFGQVMSVLTTLLQDAARKEATGAPSTAAELLAAEESAVAIKVTPVAGSSTFFVNKASARPRSAHGTATPVAATAAHGSQVAVQAVAD